MERVMGMQRKKAGDSKTNPERDFGPKYGICDKCHEPANDLIDCPSSFEEVKDRILHSNWFCSDCCEGIFEDEGCQSDVGNCDRATLIMERKLKKYAKINSFKPFVKLEKAYVDRFGAFVIGSWGTSPSTPDDDPIFIPEEDILLFEGDEAVIIRTGGTTLSFSRYTIDEIAAAFKSLGSDRNGYFFLKKRQFLGVNGIGLWAFMPPFTKSPGLRYYENERERFIQVILEGHKLFRLSKDDGVSVVDLQRMSFNWEKLTDQQFEELCADIFCSLDEIKEVQVTAGTADLGQDIVAIETWNTLLGPSERKWTIQCKRFTARNVLPSDIRDLPNAYSQLKFDVFCLMTCSHLSPSCYRLLECWRTNRALPFTVQFWDRTKIENFLRSKPDIYAKYFSA